jgi:hypothetical protein
MKAVGGVGSGGGQRRASVLTAVDGKWAASSPVIVGGIKAIISVQWKMVG